LKLSQGLFSIVPEKIKTHHADDRKQKQDNGKFEKFSGKD